MTILISSFSGAEIWAKEADLFIFSEHNPSAQGDAVLPDLPGSTRSTSAVDVLEDLSSPEPSAAQILSTESQASEPLDMIAQIDAKDEDLVALLSRIAKQFDWHLDVGEIPDIQVDVQMNNLPVRDAVNVICARYDLAFVFEGPENKVLRVMLKEEYAQEFGRPFKPYASAEMLSLAHLDFFPLKQALRRLLSESGRIIEQGPRRFIAIDQPAHLEQLKRFLQQVDKPLLTKEIALKYISVEDIAEKISSSMTETISSCSFNKESNKMTIVDLEPVVQDISRFIAAMDNKRHGVTWALNVYQVLLSQAQKTGIDWEAIVSDYQEFPARQIRASQVLVQEPVLKMGKISQEDFYILVDALETVGEVKKIDMDEQCAVFGEDNRISIVPFDLSAFFEQKKTAEPKRLDPLSFYLSIQKHGEAIQIGVRPFVDYTADQKAFRRILEGMAHSGEDRDVVSVKLEKDNILVFSGMFIDQNISTKEKKPVLGDIPLLGFAFQEQKERLVRSELIIFLQSNITDLSKE